MKLCALAVLLVMGVGCTRTTDQSGRPDFSQLRSRSASAHAEHGRHLKRKKRRSKVSERQGKKGTVHSEQLRERRPPSSKPGRLGYVRGEGTGTTRHEAVVSAIAAVSAQISSTVRSSTTTRDYEDDAGSEGSVERRLKSESEFPYAELIKVVEVEKDEAGFRVLAELDKADAISAIENGFAAERRAFEREIPRIKTALASSDFAILLSQKFNPVAILNKSRNVRRMLKALGKNISQVDENELRKLAGAVSARRAKARLRIKTHGAVPESIRVGSKSVVSQALSRHGCQLVAGSSRDANIVDVHLHLATRKHREFGAHWLYLGFELKGVSRSDNQVVFSINGMPEFVHGGGMKPQQAQQAVISEFEARLKQDKDLLSSLVCVESI